MELPYLLVRGTPAGKERELLDMLPPEVEAPFIDWAVAYPLEGASACGGAPSALVIDDPLKSIVEERREGSG